MFLLRVNKCKNRKVNKRTLQCACRMQLYIEKIPNKTKRERGRKNFKTNSRKSIQRQYFGFCIRWAIWKLPQIKHKIHYTYAPLS